MIDNICFEESSLGCKQYPHRGVSNVYNEIRVSNIFERYKGTLIFTMLAVTDIMYTEHFARCDGFQARLAEHC